MFKLIVVNNNYTLVTKNTFWMSFQALILCKNIKACFVLVYSSILSLTTNGISGTSCTICPTTHVQICFWLQCNQYVMLNHRIHSLKEILTTTWHGYAIMPTSNHGYFYSVIVRKRVVGKHSFTNTNLTLNSVIEQT